MYKAGKINIKNSNNYIRFDEGKVIIESPDGKYLYTKDSILCDRVEIIQGIGILFFFKGSIVKRIKKYILDIEFEERSNCIYIYSSISEKLITLIYCDKYVNKVEMMIEEIKACEYKIGDVVYPDNVYIVNEDKSRNVFNEFDKRSIKSYVYSFYYCEIKGVLKNKEIESVDDLAKDFEFEIIDIIDNKYYKIKLKNSPSSELLNDLSNEVYYALDSNLSTKDDIISTIKNDK